MFHARRILPAMIVLSALAALAVAADAGKPVLPFDGKTFDGWNCKGAAPAESQWAVGLAKVDPADPKMLVAEPAGPDAAALVCTSGHGKGKQGRDLFSTQKFGDCTVELEVMVPQGSNSGIYLMGEYEVQVLDSFGREKLGPGDMGGIYGAQAPKVNACKKPGEWQKYVIEFRAPRFDAAGQKTANAKFIKITLNGQVLHENVEMQKQTPGGVQGKEAAEGPLMFQGNHGPVAYRNIKVTPAK
jgi:hypothetical protein